MLSKAVVLAGLAASASAFAPAAVFQRVTKSECPRCLQCLLFSFPESEDSLLGKHRRSQQVLAE